MHDIRFIRENPAAFDAGLRKRNLAPLSAELLEIDRRRRMAISESEARHVRQTKELVSELEQARARLLIAAQEWELYQKRANTLRASMYGPPERPQGGIQ